MSHDQDSDRTLTESTATEQRRGKLDSSAWQRLRTTEHHPHAFSGGAAVPWLLQAS